jgi:hypothetical protein
MTDLRYVFLPPDTVQFINGANTITHSYRVCEALPQSSGRRDGKMVVVVIAALRGVNQVFRL